MQWLLITFLVFNLASVRNEPNLEKRSELALDNANTALDQAREAYQAGDGKQVEAALGEVAESVTLAYQSLDETGKDAHRSRFFKRAELRTRELVRRIEGLREAASFEDRSQFERVRDKVADVHDNLLKRIMGKRK